MKITKEKKQAIRIIDKSYFQKISGHQAAFINKSWIKSLAVPGMILLMISCTKSMLSSPKTKEPKPVEQSKTILIKEPAELQALLEKHSNKIKDTTVSCSGDTQESFFSKKKYLYYETIMYPGAPESSPSHSILYNSEETLFCQLNIEGIIYKLEISWRKLRPYLKPTWSQEFNSQTTGTIPQVVIDELKENNQVSIIEYGIYPGQSYYIQTAGESYHLPPREEGESPRKKINFVLEISDQAFINGKAQSKLTPVFQNWSY